MSGRQNYSSYYKLHSATENFAKSSIESFPASLSSYANFCHTAISIPLTWR